LAERIKIAGLIDVLRRLQNGQTEFDFFGITSNGVDCIYFMKDGARFQIDFEALESDQIPYIEKLKKFAESKGFKITMMTYGNRRPNAPNQQAPVIRIETNSDIETTARIGTVIQQSFFNNKDDTVYDVVP